MPTIEINVRDKVAREPTGCAYIVCNNTDYTISFDFDAEWDAYSVKTARFIWNCQYRDVVFSGTEFTAPAIDDASVVAIGVFAGELRTTTPALIPCRRSILDGDGIPAPPSEDVYSQIMALLNEISAKTLDPVDKTPAMTSPVGRDADGKLWSVPGGGSGGAVTWENVVEKPFSAVGENLKVVNGALTVDTAPNVQQDNTKPITSAAVYVEVGNINALLALI